MIANLPKRGTDNYGSGAFGAPRGNRSHHGIDYACYPGTAILSPASGAVTKLGHPYADALSFRYVQITDADGLNHRIFYCAPNVQVGDAVTVGLTKIGTAQDLGKRYPGITNHVHYEIMRGSEYLDPEGLS